MEVRGITWSSSSLLSQHGSSGSPNLSCGYFLRSGMLNWNRHPQPCPRKGGVGKGAGQRGVLGCWGGSCSHRLFQQILVPVTLLISFTPVLDAPGVDTVWRRGHLPLSGFSPWVWAHSSTSPRACVHSMFLHFGCNGLGSPTESSDTH